MRISEIITAVLLLIGLGVMYIVARLDKRNTGKKE